MQKWFRGFRLKMLSMIVASGAIIIAISGYSNWQLYQVGQKLDYANSNRVPVTYYANAMAANLESISRYLWASYGEETPEAIKEAQEKVRSRISQFEKNHESLSKYSLSDSTRNDV